MIPDEHVCTPACDTFLDTVEAGLRIRRWIWTAFVSGLVLGSILAVLAAVAVAVIR